MKDQLCRGARAGKDPLFSIASPLQPRAAGLWGHPGCSKVPVPVTFCPHSSAGDRDSDSALVQVSGGFASALPSCAFIC